MKGHRHINGLVHQPPACVNVDVPVRTQCPDNHAVGTALPGHSYVGNHASDFVSIIHKVTATRTDEHMHPHTRIGRYFPGHGYEACRRGHPPFTKCRTQLDTGSASGGGFLHTGQGCGTNF